MYRRIRWFVLWGSLLCTSGAALFHGCAPASPTGTQASAYDSSGLRAARVENGLLPAVLVEGKPAAKMAIADRMARYKVPGVSVAVLDEGGIDWAKGYGVGERGGAAVTERTLFQAASISKPVAALAALRLVEQGKLSLDEDINAYLRSWKVPAGSALDGKKVTLRGILTHSAGLSVHGFRGYAQGEPVPTLLQILDGEAPANSAPIRVEIAPSTRFQYSGGGYTILQQAMIDVAGRPFADVMRDLVLGPVHMNDSTYEQPLPEELLGRAAAGYRADGNIVAGKRHTYPEQAAAGLWTTPTDLLKFAAELQKSHAGRSEILSQATAEQMLRRQFDQWGLGLQISGEGDNLRFSHSGGNEGFRCYLVAYVSGGRGAAVMTNSDAGPALYGEILRAIAAEYGWPDFQPGKKKSITLTSEELLPFTGRYQVRPELYADIRARNGSLFVRVGAEETEFVAESESKFFSPENGSEITFTRDAQGAVSEVQGRWYGSEVRAKKASGR